MKRGISLLFILFCYLVSIESALAENLVYQQAKKAGIKKCLPAIEYISDFLVKNIDIGTHSRWSITDSDRSAFTTVIEANVSDGTVFINLNVTPTLDGKCYIEYESVFRFNESCIATSQTLKNAKYIGLVNKEIAVFNQDSLDTYLIPNGKQCIMIRKEIILDANALKMVGETNRQLNDTDFSQLVLAILTHKYIAMYLHPELAGRLPVKLYFSGENKGRPLAISLYNMPVKVVTDPKEISVALQLKINCFTSECEVKVDYKPEGIWGSLKLSKQSGNWLVVESSILE